jgi:DNA-binding CsgD family transcriptional regulator
LVDSAAFGRLTARQQQCLRLVAAPATSKQIARELGISSHTVDEHIREALATLGLSDRMEAARLFLAYEGGRPPQTLSSQAVGVEEKPLDPAPTAVLERRGDGPDVRPASPEGGPPARHADEPFPLPFPTKVRPRNELDRTTRLLWIGAVLIGLILAASLFIAVAVRISAAI